MFWLIPQTAWLDRDFVFNQPCGVFPVLLERLRGTPARAKELVAGFSEDMLATRVNSKWSVKEQLGHLVDLQQLDEQRLREFLGHAPVLSMADLQNRATELANHRQRPIADILRKLAAARNEFVNKLEILTNEEVGIASIHPRLNKSIRLLDWVYFLAEHDDHHLAHARQVIR